MKKRIDEILASLRELRVYPLPPREHIMDLLSSSSGSARTRVLGTGGSRIPAILDLKLLPKDDNQILKDTGLDRKLRRTKEDVEYVLDPKLDELNKYLTYKITHLKELLEKKQGKTFWRHARWEMKHSVAFQLSAYNSVFKGWYKNRPGSQVVADLYAIRTILRGKPGKISFRRVYIPKGNVDLENGEGSGEDLPKRPLGVPSPAGRVVLRIWYNFIEMFVKEKLISFNHAFMVGRGTKTAIEDLVEKVSKAKYIYEFDLKGFFDNVPIFGTLEVLRKWGMPIDICVKLASLLLSTPNNLLELSNKVDFDKDTALQSLIARKFATSLNTFPKWQGRRVHKEIMDYLEYKEGSGVVATELASGWDKNPGFVTSKIFGRRLLDLIRNPKSESGGVANLVPGTGYISEFSGSAGGTTGSDLEDSPLVQTLEQGLEWVQKNYKHSHRLNIAKQMFKKCPMGLPQGASVSTILSLVGLKEWEQRLKKRGINLLMYADDGFLYGDEPFRVSGPKAIRLNKEKSGGVKKDGIILKPKVKFLGVELDLETGILSGKTRSGKELKEDVKVKSLRELLSKLTVDYDKNNPGVRFNLLGTYLSKLYRGKGGTPEEQENHEEKEYREDSLGGLAFTGRGILKSPRTKRAASALSMRILLETVGKAPKDSINMLKGVLSMTSDMDLRIFIALGSPFDLYCRSMAKTVGLPGVERILSEHGREIEEKMLE